MLIVYKTRRKIKTSCKKRVYKVAHKRFTKISKFAMSERPTIYCVFRRMCYTIYGKIVKVSKTFVEGSSPSAPARTGVLSRKTPVFLASPIPRPADGGILCETSAFWEQAHGERRWRGCWLATAMRSRPGRRLPRRSVSYTHLQRQIYLMTIDVSTASIPPSPSVNASMTSITSMPFSD